MDKESVVFNRLKKLLQGVGLAFTDDGITNAEIYAYSVQIDKIKDKFEKILTNSVMDTADKDTLNKFAVLLGIVTGNKSQDDILKEIKYQLSHRTIPYTKHDFETDLSAFTGSSYSLGENMTFYDIKFEYLQEFSRFLNIYSFLPVKAICNGDGLNFKSINSNNMSFLDYERQNLPFSIIDTLKEE